MTFHVCIEEYRYRFKRNALGDPVACVLPKKPVLKRLREDLGTQGGARTFAELVLANPHPQSIPSKPRRAFFVDPEGKEVKL